MTAATTLLEILPSDWEFVRKHTLFPPDGLLQPPARWQQRKDAVERVSEVMTTGSTDDVREAMISGSDARLLGDYMAVVAVALFKIGQPSLRLYLQTHERLHRLSAAFFQAAVMADYSTSEVAREVAMGMDSTWVEVPSSVITPQAS